MAVAKRQGKEKPTKIGQRKVGGPECRPQVEQAALLGGPDYRGQARGRRNIQKEEPNGWGSLFSSHLLGWRALKP